MTTAARAGGFKNCGLRKSKYVLKIGHIRPTAVPMRDGTARADSLTDIRCPGKWIGIMAPLTPNVIYTSRLLPKCIGCRAILHRVGHRCTIQRRGVRSGDEMALKPTGMTGNLIVLNYGDIVEVRIIARTRIKVLATYEYGCNLAATCGVRRL